MSTERLYKEDQYLKSCTAAVTAVREKDGFDVITCNKSVFYPRGGGQPADTGTVSRGNLIWSVTDTYDESLISDVWHLTDAPAGTFSAGDEVTLTIDWDMRFLNMQRHCGEHMLSGTFHTLFGGVNKGFHIGDGYVSIDIDLDGRLLTDEEIDLAGRMVNEAIWADLPVKVTYFDTYEESLIMPVRKAVPHEGVVSVVTVGDPDDPYDCIACCGTHPSSSAQVGLLAIYKHEPNKGMTRIFFDCGSAALARLTADESLLMRIADRYSCASQDLMKRLDTEEENLSELKARMSKLSAYVRENESSRIAGEAAAKGACRFAAENDVLSVDELLKTGFEVMEKSSLTLLALMHPETSTCLIFSDGSVKCGAMVKEKAPAHNGRGGGRDDNARAMFASASDMRAFAEDITC